MSSLIVFKHPFWSSKTKVYNPKEVAFEMEGVKVEEELIGGEETSGDPLRYQCAIDNAPFEYSIYKSVGEQTESVLGTIDPVIPRIVIGLNCVLVHNVVGSWYDRVTLYKPGSLNIWDMEALVCIPDEVPSPKSQVKVPELGTASNNIDDSEHNGEVLVEKSALFRGARVTNEEEI